MKKRILAEVGVERLVRATVTHLDTTQVPSVISVNTKIDGDRFTGTSQLFLFEAFRTFEWELFDPFHYHSTESAPLRQGLGSLAHYAVLEALQKNFQTENTTISEYSPSPARRAMLRAMGLRAGTTWAITRAWLGLSTVESFTSYYEKSRDYVASRGLI